VQAQSDCSVTARRDTVWVRNSSRENQLFDHKRRPNQLIRARFQLPKSPENEYREAREARAARAARTPPARPRARARAGGSAGAWQRGARGAPRGDRARRMRRRGGGARACCEGALRAQAA
jgi:hypothetical protein